MKVNTSITFPLWNMRRLQGIQNKLLFEECGPSIAKLIRLCLKRLYAAQKNHILRNRGRQYNTRKSAYVKHSIEWYGEQYNISHLIASGMRVSLSSMASLAVEKYLKLVYYKLLQAATGNSRKPITHFGSYQYELQGQDEITFQIEEEFHPPPLRL